MPSGLKQSGFTFRAQLLLAVLVTCIAFIFFYRSASTFHGFNNANQQTSLLQEATNLKQNLQERLRIADHALERASRDPNSSALLQISTPYFKAVNYIDESGQITPLIGEQLKLSNQTEAIRIHLAHGDSALVVLPTETGNSCFVACNKRTRKVPRLICL